MMLHNVRSLILTPNWKLSDKDGRNVQLSPTPRPRAVDGDLTRLLRSHRLQDDVFVAVGDLNMDFHLSWADVFMSADFIMSADFTNNIPEV